MPKQQKQQKNTHKQTNKQPQPSESKLIRGWNENAIFLNDTQNCKKRRWGI